MACNNKTQYWQTAMLNLLRATNVTAPATIYVALFTTAPTETTTGTEVSGGAYARQSVAFSAPANQSPTGTTISNSAGINFPAATASWGTVNGAALFDAATGGNMLYYIAFTSGVAVASGDTFAISAGNLVIEED